MGNDQPPDQGALVRGRDWNSDSAGRTTSTQRREAEHLAAWCLEEKAGVAFRKARRIVVCNLGHAEPLQPFLPLRQIIHLEFQPRRFEIILLRQQIGSVVGEKQPQNKAAREFIKVQILRRAGNRLESEQASVKLTRPRLESTSHSHFKMVADCHHWFAILRLRGNACLVAKRFIAQQAVEKGFSQPLPLCNLPRKRERAEGKKPVLCRVLRPRGAKNSIGDPFSTPC